SYAASGYDNVRCERDQLRCIPAKAVGIAPAPACFDPHIATVGPPQMLQYLHERGHASLRLPIVRGNRHEHADAPHTLRLLCPRRERPQDRRAAKQRDEFAALHSITSSARARNDSGMVSPSALAVVRLTTNSNLVGCSTGMSPGFAPRRILSTYSAARRHSST